MPDIFPHDTAVVWTRQYLKKHPSTKGDLDGTEVALHNTLAECVASINETYDAEGIQRCLRQFGLAIIITSIGIHLARRIPIASNNSPEGS